MYSQSDGTSKASFESQDYWTGHPGARLKGRYLLNKTPIEPYARANTWHTFGGSDTVTYTGVDRIKSDHKADYNTNLGGSMLEGVSGNAGVRLSW